MTISIVAQLRSRGWEIGLTLSAAALLMGAVLLTSIWTGIPIGVLTSDPVAIAKLPAYTGFLSQIGIFLWSACVTTCWISVRVLASHGELAELRRFLIASGSYALFLGIDDVFLLHEQALPSVGLSQRAIIGCYAAVALLYFFRFHAIVSRTNYALLAIAFASFGLSAALDSFPVPGMTRYFFEDGAKLLGILSWLVYLVDVGVSVICRNTISNGRHVPLAGFRPSEAAEHI